MSCLSNEDGLWIFTLLALFLWAHRVPLSVPSSWFRARVLDKTYFLARLAVMASETLLFWAAVQYLKGVCKVLNWSKDCARLLAWSLMRLYAYWDWILVNNVADENVCRISAMSQLEWQLEVRKPVDINCSYLLTKACISASVSTDRLVKAALEPATSPRFTGEDHACKAVLLPAGPGPSKIVWTVITASCDATATSGEKNEAFPNGAI